RCRHTSSSSAPPASNLLPSASFRMIWSGVCRRRLAMDVVLLHPIVGQRTRTTGGPLQGGQRKSFNAEYGPTPVALDDGTTRPTNWHDTLASESAGVNWLASFVRGPFETDETDPAVVLAHIVEGTLDP